MNMTTRRRFQAMIPGLLAVAGLGLIGPMQATAEGPRMSAQTKQELAQARRATARYHNIDNAMADGYVNIDFVIPGVGCHMMHLGLLVDGVIDLTRPEFLIYADCSGELGGRSELRAIEYAVPCGGPPACAIPAPEGFAGDDDVWAVFGEGELWTLHAWTWRHNPDGIFVKVNPRIND